MNIRYELLKKYLLDKLFPFPLYHKLFYYGIYFLFYEKIHAY